MTLAPDKKVIALCGGVGGAKLALGLSQVLMPGQLTLVVNTSDDFDHFGLRICPDLDTVLYTLAGVANRQQGWGREAETWNCFQALETMGAETWFRLGDKDLALHLQRRALLDAGLGLSAVTAQLAKTFGVHHRLLPMTDDPVATMISTPEGELSFQHYFVREQCRPVMLDCRFDGIEQASPSAGFIEALSDSDLAGVIVCPSNPFVSIAPILGLTGIKPALKEAGVPVVAVSPLVGGAALKGPAAKMFAEQKLPCNNQGVAGFYGDLVDTLLVDASDSMDELDPVTGVSFHYCNTVMKTLDDRVALARECLALISAAE